MLPALTPVTLPSTILHVQAVYAFVTLKQDTNSTDTAANKFLQYLQWLLPSGHIMPPSWYLVKRIIGALELDTYQHHVCPCHKHAWSPLPRKQWRAQRTDRCPVCNDRRFVKTAENKWEPQLVRALHEPFDGCWHTEGDVAVVSDDDAHAHLSC